MLMITLAIVRLVGGALLKVRNTSRWAIRLEVIWIGSELLDDSSMSH
jgi:hypothetical protein